MARHLQRALWAARLLTVVLGLFAVAALLHLQQQRAALAVRVTNAEPALPQGRGLGLGNLAGDDEGVPDDGGQDGDGDAEVAFSLGRLSRLLGWGSQVPDANAVEELTADRINLKDWRHLADPSQDTAGPTTEWQHSALLRAFMARYGAARSATTRSPLDVDGGEMTDYAASSASPPPRP